MYFHYQNLKKEEGASSRHLVDARFWLGREPELHCEYTIPGRGLAFKIDLNGYGDTAIGGHISLIFFALYWGIEYRPLYNFLEKITKRKDSKYTNGRSIGFSLDRNFWQFQLWHDPMDWRSTDPKWWSKSFFPQDLLFGKSKYSKHYIDSGEILVNMPEGKYLAEWQRQHEVWTYPRWFQTKREVVDFKIPSGIPVEGKGENSWDCGMDARMGQAFTWKGSVRRATEELALDVLNERQRRGGLSHYTREILEHAGYQFGEDQLITKKKNNDNPGSSGDNNSGRTSPQVPAFN